MYTLQPSSASLYVAIPGLSGIATGAGAGLIATAANLPPEVVSQTALGVALVVAAHAAIVSVYAIGAERAAYWEYRKAALKAFPVAQPEPETEYVPEPLEPGMLPIKRDAKGRIMPGYASEQEVYLPGEDGWTEIYNVQITRLQLERLYEVVKIPRRDSKIPIVYADFMKGEDKVFTSELQFKRFQRDLEAQHIGVGGRGNRFYLTERGRRVVLKRWEQLSNPSPAQKRRL